eukprot:CAMPEP_0118833950 /NCGR_PEP_ID=MMETSP1162-20130426/47163_1 /TAXON_ID=33656 /ORGANISM="Phaeocystis Sp, Strain CCMP2710" /LENGTH=70 /DNA_ID=CAMNT_0006765649 /DNA_START=97 /DNA_END=307 /DNA_ORIENTATION=-
MSRGGADGELVLERDVGQTLELPVLADHHLEAAVPADADAAAALVVREAREVVLEDPGRARGLDALGQPA